MTEAENTALIIRLTKLEADHAGLRAQNEDLRRKMSSEQEIETENALLRDRLTGVAADILRLPQTLTNDEPNMSDDKSSNDNGQAQTDAAPTPLRRPTSVPVIKPQLGETNQPDAGEPLAERLRAAPPTATRH